MTHAMVTVIAALPADQIEPVRKRIRALGNPATGAVCKDLEKGGPFVHFASLHALSCDDGASAVLVLEFSADGDDETATREIARRIGRRLEPIFKFSLDWRSGDNLAGFLLRKRVTVSQRLRGDVGLVFAGTPGKSVTDILREDQLARKVADLLKNDDPAEAARSAFARLQAVRDELRNPDWEWALEVPPPPLPSPGTEPGTVGKVLRLAWPFIRTFLWPLLLVAVPLSLWLAWPPAWTPVMNMSLWGAWPPDWDSFVPVLIATVLAFLLYLVLAVGIPVSLGVLAFTRAEKKDWVSERAPSHSELEQMFARENAEGFVQNHMVSHTVLKPARLRKLTIRIAYWVIARITAMNPRPGHLGDIGTIHFARWVKVPGKRDLLFFSNYGGSWESYLEDFITKANEGLTAVWSNTIGFPRTRLLFLDGATDGERFKRFARESMVHTPFWYSAYPRLTTANIRANSAIRRGVAAAMTEDEAVRLLALFGSSPRPVEKLEVTQMQSLIFGGMGFQPFGLLLAIDLGAEVAKNREWLSQVLPDVAFNDGRYVERAALLTIAASARGLARLGLPEEGLATFPGAFLAGMSGPGRSRLLGDVGRNDPGQWSWGRKGVDVALLVYGKSRAAVDDLSARMEALARAHGATVAHRINLPCIPEKQTDRREPFGFVDGVSQPAMRGTYRGLRNDDPIHLVEPGEFVLGYPDNRGNVPPGPHLGAAHDPRCILPIAGRDQGFAEVTAENPRQIGLNGSFLVIRQLSQDKAKFAHFCRKEGERLAAHFRDLPIESDLDRMEEFIGAKLIGRWKDGSSLIRFPYISASRLKQLTRRDPTTQAARPKALPADDAATPIDAAAKPPAQPSPAAADAAPDGADKAPAPAPIRPDNDFLFGTEDPQGLRCPYGAHVRRANPRDSLSPGSQDQIDISNRHRVLRVGRLYGPGESAKDVEGLLFMCLNGDLERQFEFIQQTWMGSTKFHGLDAEVDPIAGNETEHCDGFTIPTRHGPVALDGLPQFVTMRGGGYFFIPGRQLLNYLARG